jgi:hypothetical protein
MARSYAITRPRFWTGKTAKAVRKLAKNDPALAGWIWALSHFFFSNKSAHMLGIYPMEIEEAQFFTGCPDDFFTDAIHWLRGIDAPSKPHRCPIDAPFMDYCEEAELVWVPNMAREQIAVELKPEDKRGPALLRELLKYRKHRFSREFWELYAEPYQLLACNARQAQTQRGKSLNKGILAMVHRWGIDAPTVPVPVLMSKIDTVHDLPGRPVDVSIGQWRMENGWEPDDGPDLMRHAVSWSKAWQAVFGNSPPAPIAAQPAAQLVRFNATINADTMTRAMTVFLRTETNPKWRTAQSFARAPEPWIEQVRQQAPPTQQKREPFDPTEGGRYKIVIGDDWDLPELTNE